MNEALGLIEVKGKVASIQVADTMAKVAAVKLESTTRTKGYGWTTISITGDVAAVEAAIQAGRAVAEQYDWLVSYKVIPRPATGIQRIFRETKPAVEKRPAAEKSVTPVKTKSESTVAPIAAAQAEEQPVTKTAEVKPEVKEAAKPLPKAEAKPVVKTVSKPAATKPVTKPAAKAPAKPAVKKPAARTTSSRRSAAKKTTEKPKDSTEK